jgi:hypothetical protein
MTKRFASTQALNDVSFTTAVIAVGQVARGHIEDLCPWRAR